MRGFFTIGVWHGKSPVNIGTLWRHANLYEAAFVFTVGKRYECQASDTLKTHLHIPVINFTSIEDVIKHLPLSCPLVGVELNAESISLPDFTHAERNCYLLGAEDHGLSPEVLTRCHKLVSIPCPTAMSMNVATAGTLVMYDRYLKRRK